MKFNETALIPLNACSGCHTEYSDKILQDIVRLGTVHMLQVEARNLTIMADLWEMMDATTSPPDDNGSFECPFLVPHKISLHTDSGGIVRWPPHVQSVRKCTRALPPDSLRISADISADTVPTQSLAKQPRTIKSRRSHIKRQNGLSKSQQRVQA